jgi:putative ABC transport system permease protein
VIDWLTRAAAYIRGIVRRQAIEREADDELAFHISQETARHVARGIAPAEARRLALKDLGGLTQTRESIRGVRTIWPDLLWRDLRHAARALAAAPAFSGVALVILTLSIGASTSIYSLVDAVVLRPLPFDRSDRLVEVEEFNFKDPAGGGSNLAAPQNFLDWRDQQTSFTALAAIVDASISLRGENGSEPETLPSQMVSANFFSVLGVRPLIGQPFTAANEADGRARVAVISHGLWQRRFGGAPDVLAHRLPSVLGDFEIAAVMPPDFSYPAGARDPTEIWVPYVAPADERVRGTRFGYNLQVIGRLRDGVTIARAQADMDQITARLAAATPSWFTDRAARVEPLQSFVTDRVRAWMFVLLGAVAFVMLIACVNLASLMLVRATTRARELGVRSALGASRWDLTRVLLAESLLLALLGAAFGVALAVAGVDVLRAALPADVPRVAAIAVNLRVLAATAGVAVVTALAFGLAPAVQFARPAPWLSLAGRERANTAGAGTQRLRSSLVVAEVALAAILLVGAGLFLASFARVSSIDLGLDRHDVLTLRIRPLVGGAEGELALQRNPDRLMSVLERVRALPGIASAGLVSGGLPFRGDLRTEPIRIPGRELRRNQDIDLNQVSPGYFETMRVPLIRGRFVSDADTRTSAPVLVIDEAAARRYFPAGDALGQPVVVDGPRTVIGVVGSVRFDGPEATWRTQAFEPLAQSHVTGATLVVRTARVASGLPALKRVGWSEFPDLPIPDVRMLDEYVAALTAQRRFNMLLLGLFGVVGVAVAAIGIYGVMAYTVAQRTTEIGIRLALGAAPRAIERTILGSATVYLAGGLALGTVGALALARLVESFLFHTTSHDLLVYASALALLAMAGLTAAFLPARRAARIDPLSALRAE